MLNIPLAILENPNIKNEPNYKFGKSIRYMAQTLGTEWGRNLIHSDIWIELAKEKILHQFSMGQSVIITDLRFHNEVDAVKSLGGHVIHLIRDDNVFDKKAAVNGVSNHVSDASIPFDEIDFTVNNNKGIKELELEVSKIIQRII